MRFARIEIHFATKDDEDRDRTVTIKPGGDIQGILLNPSKPPRDRIPPAIAKDNPDLVNIEDGDGPGVCYMIDGTLHCW